MSATASAKAYCLVYVALVAMTLLTCGLSFLPQIDWHTAAGLAIATVKASLIAIFFMHLQSSNRLPWFALLAGLCWLAILIGLTLTDFLSRSVLSY